MPDKIKMVKDDEETFVHPGAVGNYERSGWTIFVESVVAESAPEPVEDVSVETAQPQAAPKAVKKPKPKTKAAK